MPAADDHCQLQNRSDFARVTYNLAEFPDPCEICSVGSTSWSSPPHKQKIRQRPTLPLGDPVVPSALEGLTAVFGMGTGVTPPP